MALSDMGQMIKITIYVWNRPEKGMLLDTADDALSIWLVQTACVM